MYECELTYPQGHARWPQRQADLLPLYIAATNASSNSAQTLQAHAALNAALTARVRVDEAVRAAVVKLLAEPQVDALIQVWAVSWPDQILLVLLTTSMCVTVLCC